jgi:hypothetical protein
MHRHRCKPAWRLPAQARIRENRVGFCNDSVAASAIDALALLEFERIADLSCGTIRHARVKFFDSPPAEFFHQLRFVWLALGRREPDENPS